MTTQSLFVSEGVADATEFRLARKKSRSSQRRGITLSVSNLEPVKAAEITFGDLTVIVGPQATGKSVFLQTLKLLIDRDHIHDTFKQHNMSVSEKPDVFFDAYYGRGMWAAIGEQAGVRWQGKTVQLSDYAKPSRSVARYERVFYIPAQRVMSLPGGVSQNFGQFNFGDPYALRAFSDAVHDLIQNELGAKGNLFPAPNLLNKTLRDPISKHLFGGNRLIIDEHEYTKNLALSVPGKNKPLGFLSWSAGQREFVPMLMGLYWLCTSATSRRKTGKTKDEAIEWVIIEEPEMGLHPKAITAVLLLIQELLRREYRVVVSTHSNAVLEMIWAIQELKSLEADESDIRKLFDLPSTNSAKELGKSALSKSYRVYFFDRESSARDISLLDPTAESAAESDWGGLTGFSSSTNEVIASAVNRADKQSSKTAKRTRKAKI